MAALKAELRKRCRAVRAAMPEGERFRRSRQACEAAIRLLESRLSQDGRDAPVLFGYVPYGTEPDVSAVLEWCWARGGTVVVPKVVRGSRDMTLHAITGFHELEAGAWGIREPRKGHPAFPEEAAIDAVLVPGLAFDASGGRLGYGGGFYDVFMRRRSGASALFKLAVAFDALIVPEVPMDDFDFRVDAVVTESRVWTTAEAGNHACPER